MTHNDPRELLIVDALMAGQPYREIAAEHRVSFTVIADIARRMSTLNKDSVEKYLQIKALDAIDAWHEAMWTGARMGKHAPARDLLIHAKQLDPLTSEQQTGAKVAIIIGQPGQPVDPMSVQVIDVQGVTSAQDE